MFVRQVFGKRLTILLIFFSLCPSLAIPQQIGFTTQINNLIESYNYDEALLMMDRLIQLDSTNPELYMLKAKSLAALNKYGEAVIQIKKGYNYDSANLKVISCLIELLSQSGDIKTACNYAVKRVNLAPENRYFKFQLANLYYQSENYTSGLKVLIPIYSTDTMNVSLMKQIVNGFAGLDKTDSAILFCKRILKLIPYDPGITNKLANIYIKTNNIRKGIDLTEGFLQQDSSNVLILKSNAYLYYLAKDYSKAVMRFKSAFVQGDSSRFSYKYTGLAYYRQEVYDTAYTYFMTTYEMDTTENEILFYYGVCAAKSYRLELGMDLLRKTLTRLKSSEQFMSLVYLEVASLYNDFHRPDTAMMMLKMAYERNRANIDILFRIAYQHDNYLENYKEAISYYRQFILLCPEERINKLAQVKKAAEINVSLYDYAKQRVAELVKKGY